MGSLFQLVFAALGYVFLVTIAGFVLLLLAKVLSFFFSKSKVSVESFFWFPIKLGPYFLLAIFANIIICELVRDVDPPLTDYWSLPVNKKLTLGAIDVTDKWYLWTGREGGEAIVSDIVLVGISDKAVYGATESGRYFIYPLNAGQKLNNLSEDEFESKIIKIEGVVPALQHPAHYYYDKRNLGDLITLLLMLIYPLWQFYMLCKGFRDRLMQPVLSCTL